MNKCCVVALLVLVSIAVKTSAEETGPSYLAALISRCAISTNICSEEEVSWSVRGAISGNQKNDLLKLLPKVKPDEFGPLLSFAIYAGVPEIVDVFLDNGVDPLVSDRHGSPYLYNGIMKVRELTPENIECVRRVLERAKKLGRLASSEPLEASLAFRHGDEKGLALLKVFLQYGADPFRGGRYSYFGRPLDIAIAKNNFEAIRILVAPGSGISALELDKRAFQALKEERADLLSIFKSAGADPKRYINANPKLLFDAVRSNKGMAELEFLLRNGADPNVVEHESSKHTPILAAGFDLEKMTLLLKHGAELNVKGGPSVLESILFYQGAEVSISPVDPNQEARRYNKVSIVKFLLDHGADPNTDIGGWGQWGALGVTRREDKEVIDLLVKRGATLRHEKGKSVLFPQIKQRYGEITADNMPGPITIAIAFLERDDLALALLTRDARLISADKFALFEASRRGWGEVARALIHAGADPNVADSSGLTPLAMAERRRDQSLIKMLISAGAKPTTRTVKSTLNFSAKDEFAKITAEEIDDVIFLDPPRFSLSGGGEASFVFYGDGINKFEEVNCSRSVKFSVIANMGVAGEIRVGSCGSEAKRIDDLANRAEARLQELLKELKNHGANVNEPNLAEFGWLYEKKRGPSGSSVYYFPLIGVGHGILSAPTAIIVSKPKDQVIVVQAEVARLCDEGRNMRDQTPLCRSVQSALVDIAQRLFSKKGL